jgi:DOPA 4,5-dioxygenase
MMRDNSDVHIYYFQENVGQKTFARELWERVRRECEF